MKSPLHMHRHQWNGHQKSVKQKQNNNLQIGQIVHRRGQRSISNSSLNREDVSDTILLLFTMLPFH